MYTDSRLQLSAPRITVRWGTSLWVKGTIAFSGYLTKSQMGLIYCRDVMGNISPCAPQHGIRSERQRSVHGGSLSTLAVPERQANFRLYSPPLWKRAHLKTTTWNYNLLLKRLDNKGKKDGIYGTCQNRLCNYTAPSGRILSSWAWKAFLDKHYLDNLRLPSRDYSRRMGCR